MCVVLGYVRQWARHVPGSNSRGRTVDLQAAATERQLCEGGCTSVSGGGSAAARTGKVLAPGVGRVEVALDEQTEACRRRRSRWVWTRTGRIVRRRRARRTSANNAVTVAAAKAGLHARNSPEVQGWQVKHQEASLNRR